MKKHIYLATILTLFFSSYVNAQSQYPEGSVFDASGPTKVVDVTNPKTGKTWMDRNLGASRVATSSTDVESYGDLYQWGRRADGHQLINSTKISALSNIDQPAHGDFITTNSEHNDWRSPRNDNLWQGVHGVNNPCPTGYRIPTDVELDEERASWGSSNGAGALSSPLKLPLAGFRHYYNNALNYVGEFGLYWSSTVNGNNSRNLNIASSPSKMNTNNRGFGFSVRCIKD
jgi:uncharacterized protein (TIGR02145 family)